MQEAIVPFFFNQVEQFAKCSDHQQAIWNHFLIILSKLFIDKIWLDNVNDSSLNHVIKGLVHPNGIFVVGAIR